jgi:hypothetical protein
MDIREIGKTRSAALRVTLVLAFLLSALAQSDTPARAAEEFVLLGPTGPEEVRSIAVGSQGLLLAIRGERLVRSLSLWIGYFLRARWAVHVVSIH